MSWRTVIISSRCKLDLKMGYMVVRGEDTKRVFLDEVAIVIIENPAVSITGCLISALLEKKVKVIFCDEKRNPSGELVRLYGCHDCSSKIKAQIGWSQGIKGAVWTEIVTEKIRNQMNHLDRLKKDKEAEMLRGYIAEIEFCDDTNREGHAAKVYFNGIFGMDFSRNSDNAVNAALNYGYGLILSAVNREVVSNGYLTQLGLFHDNMFNQFNLSCDLMEPYRVFVDMQVKRADYRLFETDQKREMVKILNETVTIDGKRQSMLNSIKVYVKSVFAALNDGDTSLIRFPQYEL